MALSCLMVFSFFILHGCPQQGEHQAAPRQQGAEGNVSVRLHPQLCISMRVFLFVCLFGGRLHHWVMDLQFVFSTSPSLSPMPLHVLLPSGAQQWPPGLWRGYWASPWCFLPLEGSEGGCGASNSAQGGLALYLALDCYSQLWDIFTAMTILNEIKLFYRSVGFVLFWGLGPYLPATSVVIRSYSYVVPGFKTGPAACV